MMHVSAGNTTAPVGQCCSEQWSWNQALDVLDFIACQAAFSKPLHLPQPGQCSGGSGSSGAGVGQEAPTPHPHTTPTQHGESHTTVVPLY